MPPQLSKVTKTLMAEAETLTGLKPKVVRMSGKHIIVQIGKYKGSIPKTPSDHRSTLNWMSQLVKIAGKAEDNGVVIKKRIRRKVPFRYGTIRSLPANLGKDLAQAIDDAGHTRNQCADLLRDNNDTPASGGTVGRTINDKNMRNIGCVMYEQMKKYIRMFGGEAIAKKYGGRVQEPAVIEEKVEEAFRKVDETVAPTNGAAVINARRHLAKTLSTQLASLRNPEIDVILAIAMAMLKAEPLGARCTLLVREAQARRQPEQSGGPHAF
jgi:hypothetical protein